MWKGLEMGTPVVVMDRMNVGVGGKGIGTTVCPMQLTLYFLC